MSTDRLWRCKVCGQVSHDELCCPDPQALRPPQPPPPGVIYPPSHLTRAQAARILKRTGGTVYGQSRKGGPLEAETWHGTKMIPAWRVMLELKKIMEAEP